MKIRLQTILSIAASTTLLIALAQAQASPKPDATTTTTTTIVSSGDISITHSADGKTAVYINFAPGKAKSAETRLTISGPYSIDVNGGVQEVQGPQGLEFHVLSHEELRFEAPEIATWEQAHKYSESTACGKIPKFRGCGNPTCDQFGHPGDQCRYNSISGCACVAPGGGPCNQPPNPLPTK
jgi:hypothetical protein